MLNDWPQRFNEWFGIECTGQFWVENPGEYRFSLMSDDGNHSPSGLSASAYLSSGIHQMRVTYFQGPRYLVALVLAIGPPGEAWRIFDSDDFLPPKDESEWVKGEISDVRHSGEYRRLSRCCAPLDSHPKQALARDVCCIMDIPGKFTGISELEHQGA